MNPKTQITLILFALCGYMIFPLDFIPDVIPILGELDDMGVVLWGLDSIVKIARKEERTIIGKVAA
jgi:uncharacterized membrane protein YkvA (DUF1232 family)